MYLPVYHCLPSGIHNCIFCITNTSSLQSVSSSMKRNIRSFQMHVSPYQTYIMSESNVMLIFVEKGAQ